LMIKQLYLEIVEQRCEGAFPVVYDVAPSKSYSVYLSPRSMLGGFCRGAVNGR
jgi:hypothetical protein